MLFIVHVTLSLSCRERRQEFIPPEVWPTNSPDLNPMDYSISNILQERVYHSQIRDVKELKEPERVESAGPHHHRGSDCTVA